MIRRPTGWVRRAGPLTQEKQRGANRRRLHPVVGATGARGQALRPQHHDPPSSRFRANPNSRVQSHATERSRSHGTTRKMTKSSSGCSKRRWTLNTRTVRTTDVIMMDARVFMRSPNSMVGTKSPVQRQRRKTTLWAQNAGRFPSVLRLLSSVLCPLVSPAAGFSPLHAVVRV